jgi:hypothetical protein
VCNRIAHHFRPQASGQAQPETIPFSRPTSPTPTPDTDNGGLPPVYHSACGSRCVWSYNRRTAFATPICLKCTRFQIAG